MPDATAGERARLPRRRVRLRAILFLFALLAAAVAAFAFAPSWLPRIFGDDGLIDYERSQRFFRSEFKLPLPGQPDLARFPERLAASGLKLGEPVLIRIYKRDFELEVWMQSAGVFHRFATYPICRWSGYLGPKLREGDGQAPEGFYTVDASALNPNSNYYRSFNVGYPNAFDRAKGRTGSLIMVHGDCRSIGCFAMTNAQIAEIWKLVTAALGAGQKRFQVQIYPFRMSDRALAGHAGDANAAFWRDLKTGSDLFEKTSLPPRVSVCDGRYRFEAGTAGADGSNPIVADCSSAAANK
jgi:murein L,D-transpeptidase YafK